MAILSATQLTEIRQSCAKRIAVNYTKAQINVVLQALEDWYETSGRTAAGTAMENAAPGVFSAARKKQLAAFWLLQKAGREGL